MASTNSNKGRAVVLSAACVTMFFISSIALYSVVSKNLLAVYPEWSSALTWAFPVFQTIMAVTGIFAGRISDKIGPRNVVIAAAVCYGLGWFMSGTVTEPWQFYLWFSLVAAIGNGLGYNPALTTGQKWFIDKKGLASGITLAASTAGPAVLSPVLASLLIPSLGIFGALKALGVIFFVMIAASALFLKAPEAGWLPEGFEAPKGGAHAGTFGDLTPGEMVKTPRFWVLIITFAFAATAGTLLVGKVASIAAVQLFADPTSAAAAVGTDRARGPRGEELGVRQTARLGRAGHKGRDDVSLGQALGEGVHAVHVLKHNGVDEWMALDAADVRTHAAAERGKVAADIARA